MVERPDNIEIAAIGPEHLFAPARPLPAPRATFTVSARGKTADEPVFGFLRRSYGNLPLREIDSVFGFVERSTLYGGRRFTERELSDEDVRQLNAAGIGIRLPMSNHFVELREYKVSRALLRKHHCKGNSVICTNDDLARWIRADFPDYRIDASVIKNVKTHEKIEELSSLYDSVVLPMRLNDDLEFLGKIRDKDRITLFANAGCALTCPSHICYVSVSRANKPPGGEFQCSQPLKKRDMHGMVDFPLEQYVEMGFHRFKLLRARPGYVTGF
jgi:hypothetical protein